MEVRMEIPIQVTKLALVYNPPILIVEYIKQNISKNYHHKKIRFNSKFLNGDHANSPDSIANDLISLLPEYLGSDQVSFTQVVNLITNLITARTKKRENENDDEFQSNHFHLSSLPKQIIIPVSEKLHHHIDSNNDHGQEDHSDCIGDLNKVVPENEDLNKVSEEDLNEAKEKMSVMFDSNRVLPGDKEYVYDKRVEYDLISESSWD